MRRFGHCRQTNARGEVFPSRVMLLRPAEPRGNLTFQDLTTGFLCRSVVRAHDDAPIYLVPMNDIASALGENAIFARHGKDSRGCCSEL
jgi:hypothetical protein